MTLKTIRLELARDANHPSGDFEHGYIFRAPLDTHGHFDRFRWAAVKQLCTVRRLEKGHEVEHGLLVLNRRGKWVFSYTQGDEDDETLFRLGDHHFRPGEYISVTEHDGVQRTFKVASVADWHPVATPAVAL